MINKRVLTYVCTDELWISAQIRQQSVHLIKPGDLVEVALEMYQVIFFMVRLKVLYMELVIHSMYSVELYLRIGNLNLLKIILLKLKWEKMKNTH